MNLDDFKKAAALLRLSAMNANDEQKLREWARSGYDPSFVPAVDEHMVMYDFYVSMMKPELGLALADTMDMMADAYEDVGFPPPMHQGAFPITKVAKLILEAGTEHE